MTISVGQNPTFTNPININYIKMSMSIKWGNTYGNSSIPIKFTFYDIDNKVITTKTSYLNISGNLSYATTAGTVILDITSAPVNKVKKIAISVTTYGTGTDAGGYQYKYDMTTHSYSLEIKYENPMSYKIRDDAVSVIKTNESFLKKIVLSKI